MSKEIVGEESVEGSVGKNSVGGKKKPWTVGRVVALVASVVILFPYVYGMSHVLLSGLINRAFHSPKECTITAVVAQKGGSKSSSSSSNIYIQSPDCSDLRFVGSHWGYTHQEVAERIREFKGQKVVVEVGVWQTPFAATDIVGIEGLDLSK